MPRFSLSCTPTVLSRHAKCETGYTGDKHNININVSSHGSPADELTLRGAAARRMIAVIIDAVIKNMIRRWHTAFRFARQYFVRFSPPTFR